MNLKIRKLEEDLIAVLNASDVPAEAKKLILINLGFQMEAKATQIMAAEIKMEVEKNGLCKENVAEHAEH